MCEHCTVFSSSAIPYSPVDHFNYLRRLLVGRNTCAPIRAYGSHNWSFHLAQGPVNNGMRMMIHSTWQCVLSFQFSSLCIYLGYSIPILYHRNKPFILFIYGIGAESLVIKSFNPCVFIFSVTAPLPPMRPWIPLGTPERNRPTCELS